MSTPIIIALIIIGMYLSSYYNAYKETKIGFRDYLARILRFSLFIVRGIITIVVFIGGLYIIFSTLNHISIQNKYFYLSLVSLVLLLIPVLSKKSLIEASKFSDYEAVYSILYLLIFPIAWYMIISMYSLIVLVFTDAIQQATFLLVLLFITYQFMKEFNKQLRLDSKQYIAPLLQTDLGVNWWDEKLLQSLFALDTLFIPINKIDVKSKYNVIDDKFEYTDVRCEGSMLFEHKKLKMEYRVELVEDFYSDDFVGSMRLSDDRLYTPFLIHVLIYKKEVMNEIVEAFKRKIHSNEKLILRIGSFSSDPIETFLEDVPVSLSTSIKFKSFALEVSLNDLRKRVW